MTHNDRVLALLSDGQPHSHHELYALHVIAHSRVSDLRKRGHAIDMWRDGDLYLYRLNQSGAAVGESAVSGSAAEHSADQGDRVVPASGRPERAAPEPPSGDTDPCGPPPPQEQVTAARPADTDLPHQVPVSSVSPVEPEQLRLVA